MVNDPIIRLSGCSIPAHELFGFLADSLLYLK
jgi:hypothetical protein